MNDITTAARMLYSAAPATRSMQSAVRDGEAIRITWPDATIAVTIKAGDDMAPVNAILEACREYDRLKA